MGEHEPSSGRDLRYSPDLRIDRLRTAAAATALGGLTLILHGVQGFDKFTVTVDMSKPEVAAGTLLVATVVILAGNAINSHRK